MGFRYPRVVGDRDQRREGLSHGKSRESGPGRKKSKGLETGKGRIRGFKSIC